MMTPDAPLVQGDTQRGRCRIGSDLLSFIYLGNAAALIVAAMRFQPTSSTGYSFWMMGIVSGAAVSFSAFANSFTSCAKNSTNEPATRNMSWSEYAKFAIKGMFSPLQDPRRFFGLGSLISNTFLTVAECIMFDNLKTARAIVTPIYDLLQFTALTLPSRTVDAALSWSIIKGAFQVVSIYYSVEESSKNWPVIASNTILLLTCSITGLAAAIAKTSSCREAPVERA